MNPNMILYSFIEVYKKDNDIKELFATILLHFSKDNGENNLKTILGSIKNELSVDIPHEIGKNLVKKLKKSGYVEETKSLDKYILSEKGRDKKEDLIKNQITNPNNKIIKKIENELNNMGMNSTLKEILNTISESNMMQLDFHIKEQNKYSQKISKDITIFGEYFNKLERDSEEYKVISSILLCFILSHYLGRNDIQQNLTLNGLDVYLDSNILVSLFGLDSDDVNESIKDLKDILIQHGCNLKVFDITINEFISTLLAYDPDKYIAEYKVNSMHYFMKIKGITKEKVELMAGNIEELLENQGIKIDYDYNTTRENKNYERFQGYENELQSFELNTQINKELKKDRARRHDIAAYSAIKDIRKKKNSIFKSLLEECGAVFLTSDIGLCKFVTQKVEKYRTGVYIPEVIHNYNLLTYVRYKNPVSNKNLLFQDFIISSHQQKFISDDLWNSFIYELKKNVDEKKYTEEECEQLIAMKETKEKLLNLEKNVTYNENHGYDFSNIINEENIAKVKDEKDQKDRQIKNFFKTNKILEEEKNTINNQLINIEETIKFRAQKKAERWRVSLIVLLGFLLIFFLSVIGYKFNWLFSLITSGIFLIFDLCFYLIRHRELIEYLREKTENFKNVKIQKFIIKEKKRVGFRNYDEK